MPTAEKVKVVRVAIPFQGRLRDVFIPLDAKDPTQPLPKNLQLAGGSADLLADVAEDLHRLRLLPKPDAGLALNWILEQVGAADKDSPESNLSWVALRLPARPRCAAKRYTCTVVNIPPIEAETLQRIADVRGGTGLDALNAIIDAYDAASKMTNEEPDPCASRVTIRIALKPWPEFESHPTTRFDLSLERAEILQDLGEALSAAGMIPGNTGDQAMIYLLSFVAAEAARLGIP